MAPWSGFWGGRAVLAGGDAYRGGTPVVVRMDNPNWSISEIDGDGDDEGAGFLPGAGGRRRRRRGKNAKQITWVLLLKAHRAAGCLASLASAAVALGGAARRRVAAGCTVADAEDEDEAPAPPRRSRRFYAFIRAFLLLSVFLLAVELAAHANGRRLAAPAAVSLAALHAAWVRFRAAYVAPPLQLLADACVVLFLVQSADRLVQSLGCFYIHLKRLKPKPVSPPALPDAEDPDAGYYPMVLVQIPMCNEKEVTMQHLHLPLRLKFQFFHQPTRDPIFLIMHAVHCSVPFRCTSSQLRRSAIWIGPGPISWCRCWTTPMTRSHRH